VNAHERERLAAWLDGELDPGERAQVEAHLAACSECAALLAEMEALDEVVRSAPVEAPSGYFDRLPGRVRGRIESDAGRPAPVGGRVPAWTWAVAAALLLAVISPLTLDRLALRDPSGPERAAPLRQDARPRPSALAEEERDESGPAEPETDQESRAKGETGPGSPPDKDGSQPPAAFATAPAAEPEAAAGSRSREALAAGGEVSPPPAAPAAVGAVPSEAETPPLLEDAPEEATAAPKRGSPRAEENRAGRDAPGPVTAAAPLKGSAATARVQDRQEGFAAAERKALPEDSRAYARLARVAPSGAAAWRERREAWRSFLDTHPESRHADEARVRLIEAGLQAWRAGGHPEDLARARDDARAYLARDDARQKERVRRALAEVGGG
jgi:hypothetical protein